MSLEGFTKVPIKKIGGLVTNFASETVPNGVSPDCRNVRFTLNSVAVRYGVQPTINTGKKKAVNSLGMLVRTGLNPPQFPLLFNSDGTLSYETAPLVGGLPAASGVTQDLTPTLSRANGRQMFTWTQNTFLGMSPGFQNMYMVNGDLRTGAGSPAVTDGTHLDPMTQRPWAEFWQANTFYNVGEVISPNPANGHQYRCTREGTSGANQPNFSTADSSVLVEGPDAPQLQWTEYTFFGGDALPELPMPAVVRVPGAGAFPAGRDVYIFITMVNGNGETAGSQIFFFQNTALNDRFQVPIPVNPPAWTLNLQGAFLPTGCMIYEADVPTGNAAPVISAFKRLATIPPSTPFGFGSQNIDASTGGAVPSGVNTATICPPGKVASGVRYGAMVFVNRYNNISGFNILSVVPITLVANGLQIYMANIAVGPANCTQRIIILGAALNSSGGPFFYIDVNQSSSALDLFVINDNVTTAKYLDFSDDKLGAATDATNLTRRIKLPPQADIRYIESLKRFVTCGEAGQPSLARWSEPDNPEAFYGDTGFKYYLRDNGQRLITHREYENSIVIAFKEKQALNLRPNNNDPLNWPADNLWIGSGPSGPNAVDVQQTLLAYAHESGAYVWQGSGDPDWVSQEIDDLWKQINWDFGHRICVTIDNIEKEIHFFVPFGKSTVNNVEFCLNYKRGLGPPVVYSSFTGKEIAKPAERKWSINDIACNQAIRAQRRFVEPDGTVFESCFLMASPFAQDSGVLMTQPGSYSDNGKGYDAHYETSTVGDGDSIYKFGGAIFSAKGNGNAQLYGIPFHGLNLPLKPKVLGPQDNRWYTSKAPGGKKSRQWGLGISNGGAPNVYWELFEAKVAICPTFDEESSYVSA